jgi:hypothetical protein
LWSAQQMDVPQIAALGFTSEDRAREVIHVDFVEFEDLSVSQGTLDFGALKVKQIVFVQHDGEWILVLQVVRVGTATPPVDEVYAYQYVSYPTRVAEQMSESEAIEYVNTILRLASAVQRR